MRLRLVAVATMILASCGSARHSRNEAIQIAIGGRAALDFIPIYLTSSLGFFRDADLEVTLQDLPSTAKAIQALLGGSSDVIAGGYDGAVQMTLQGQPIQAVALLERWPPLGVVAAPPSGRPMRTIRDLKGRVVGVSSPGSSTHRFLNYLLVKNGLSVSDISVVGVGVNFSMAAAVQHGQVDAAVAGPLGMELLAQQPNLTILADCRTVEGARQTLGTAHLPFMALLTRPEWTRTHREALRKLVQATRRTLAWIQKHSAEDVRNAMPPEYRGQEAAVYLRAIRNILSTFSPDGAMPAEGPAQVKEFLSVSDPQVRDTNIDLKATYTNEFVQTR